MSIQLIQQYYSNVDKLIRYGGTRNEMSLRKAFQELLDHYARSKNLVLVPEVGVLGKRGRTVHPDGTLKDALRQDWGYWESKDEKDTLEDEMRTKFAKGYPDFNILFEDTQAAVLIQGGNEIQRAEFSDAKALDALLTLDDPARREFYQMVSAEKDIPVFALVVMDYLSEPSFKPLDLSEYRGQVGDPIQIRALQDIGLASVNVELLTSGETVLEQGRAFEKSVRTGYWIYMGQTAQPLGSQITIRVTGMDHTGKQAEIAETVVVGEQA